MTNYELNSAKSTGAFAFTLRDVLAVGFRHKRVLGTVPDASVSQSSNVHHCHCKPVFSSTKQQALHNDDVQRL